MKKLNKCVLTAAVLSVALIFSPFTNAFSLEVKSGNDKASLSLYGQVDRAVLRVDDGKDTDTFHVDNDASSTRIGLKGKAKKDNLTVGTQIEIEYESDSSSKVKMNDTQQGDRNNQRKLFMYLEHGSMGKLSFGQGSTASDGTSSEDLSGTGLAELSISSFVFYDVTNKVYSGVDIGDVVTSMNGASRKDMIRYDTPIFSNFQLSTSTYNNDGQDDHDFAIRYSAKIGGVKFAAAGGYISYDSQNATIDDQMNGSLSVLLPMGFNFTVATGKRDHKVAGRNDGKFTDTKLGYKTEIWDAGPIAFSIDYGRYSDIAQNRDETKAYGFQVVQKLSDWSTELYCGYRKYSLDRPGSNFNDISAVMAGARIKF